MRIIDKNTDFYDYLQGIYPDRSVTFDRTDSYILTKQIMCDHFNCDGERLYNIRHRWVLLQVCNTFWLFLIDITKTDDCNRPENYSVELLSTWKNYEMDRSLIKLDIISPRWASFLRPCYTYDPALNTQRLNKEEIKKYTRQLIDMVNTKNYSIRRSVNKHTVFNGDGTSTEKHIPILKASGFAACINPLDIYLSIEEYFSLEKQSLERTESIGITNKEKIENHGFDVKTSFRGKQ